MAEPSYLKNLIIAAIVVVVLLVFLQIFSNGVLPLVKDEVCKQSIEANAKGHIRGLTTDSEINCPTNLEPIKATSEIDKKKEIAERMNKCWTKFKAGRAELFSNEKVYCSICDVIEFEDKKSITGFESYLIQTAAPGKANDISYMDYFSGYETKKAEEAIKKLNLAEIKAIENSELDGNKRYAVVFLYAKGKNEMEKVIRHLSLQTTAGKIGLVGAGIGSGVAGTTAGLTVLALGSNPVGWAIGAALVTGTAIEAFSYFLSSDNQPEWASFIILREYNAQSLKELSCEEIK